MNDLLESLKGSDPPIHPLSSIAVIALDALWSLVELGTAASIVGLPLLIPIIFISGLSGFLTVTWLQRDRAGDDWPAALLKGFVLGLVLALPLLCTGTAVGVAFLGWAAVRSQSSSA